MMDTLEILVAGLFVIVMGAATISLILFIVGETVEHFTP